MNEASATGKSTSKSSFLPKKRKKITASYLENAGAYYLERFSASIQQFRTVMQRKITNSCRDHPEQSIDDSNTLLEAVISKFISLGYLNDTTYGVSLLRTLQQKGYSRNRILQTMRHKGLSQDILDDIVPEAQPLDDFCAALKMCKRKKLGPYALRTRPNEMQRSLATLARAGFSYACAQKALNLKQDDIAQYLED
ncbi:MAG: regulatory protein RecX [Pseudomonadota bacterium]